MAAAGAALALAAWAPGAWAQSGVPPAGTAPPFVLQSDNGDNRIQFGTVVHVDGRFFPGDAPQSGVDTFALRRVRGQVEGHLARHFPFHVNVDFAGGVVNVRDAWFETRVSQALHVRVGKFRAPFSYDRLTRVANLLFVERGLTTTVAPDREVGVQVLGDVLRGRLGYEAALSNGVIDGGVADVDTNNGKDLTGRVVVRPWLTHAAHPLRGLGVALAANTGTQPGPLPFFQLPGRQVYFTYDDALGEGTRTRWSPQGFYYHGPFGGYAEYVHSEGDVRRADVRDRVTHEAWQAAASWVLTGEPAIEQRNERPRANFDPPSHHYGALQVAARYQMLAVSQNAVSLGFASPTASRHVRVLTLGLNWYLNPFVKWNLNYEHSVFAAPLAGSRPDEHAILLRAHFGF
jgi:phosphate-selective porin OprO/OprP